MAPAPVHLTPPGSGTVLASCFSIACVTLVLQLLRQWSPQAEYLFSLADSTLSGFKALGAPLQSVMIAAMAVYLYPSAVSRLQTAASPKGCFRQATLGEKLACHFQSHRIKFSSATSWEREESCRGKQGLLRRLVGRLQFRRQPARKPCVEGPAFLRRSSTTARSASSRRSGEGYAASNSTAPSMRVSIDGSLGGGRGCSTSGVFGTLLAGLRRPLAKGLPGMPPKSGGRLFGGSRGGGRWQPSMARIASGTNLAGADYAASSAASEATQAGGCGHNIPIIPYNGHLAADCLGSDVVDPENLEVNQVVTEDHLLQFGAFLGESSAQLALSQRGAPGPLGPWPASLYGEMDAAGHSAGHHKQGDGHAYSWELVVEEHKPGIHYWAWRHMLRKGLYMYRSRTVYEQCTTHQMMAFTFDDFKRRKEWDDSTTDLRPLPPTTRPDMPQEEVERRAYAQSSYMYARCKFPPPMAQREYIYARRIWHKADDGGCYAISRSCTHPAPPAAGCRTAAVSDFCSGFVVRAVPGIYETDPAVEVVTNYYEDPKVSAGLTNMAVRKALWPMIQKSEAGLRKFVVAYYSPSRPPPLPLVHGRANRSAAASRRQSLDASVARGLGPRRPSMDVSIVSRASQLPVLTAATDALLGAKAAGLQPGTGVAAAAVPEVRSLAAVAEDELSAASAPPSDSSVKSAACAGDQQLLSSFPVPVVEDTAPLPSSFPVPVADGCCNDAIASFPLGGPDGESYVSAEEFVSEADHYFDSTLDVLVETEGEGEEEEEEDDISVIPASWGGYYPALTRRFHLTPVLYRMYICAWALGSRLCRASWTMLLQARVDLAVCVRSGLAGAIAANAQALKAAGSAWRHLGGCLGGSFLRGVSVLRRGMRRSIAPEADALDKTLGSHTIQRTRGALSSGTEAERGTRSRGNLNVSVGAQPGSSSGPASPANNRSPRVSFGGASGSDGVGSQDDAGARNRSWGKRAAMRVAAVAVKAVGLPLAHQFLRSRSTSMSGAMGDDAVQLPASGGSSFSSQCSALGSSVPQRNGAYRGTSAAPAAACGALAVGAGSRYALPHQQHHQKLSRWPCLVPPPPPAGSAAGTSSALSSSTGGSSTALSVHPLRQPFGPRRKTASAGGAGPGDADGGRMGLGKRSMI